MTNKQRQDWLDELREITIAHFKACKKDKGWTQAEYAKRMIGCKRSCFQRWLNTPGAVLTPVFNNRLVKNLRKEKLMTQSLRMDN